MAPTAKLGNLSTPKSSVTASAGSVMMTPVMTPLNAVWTMYTSGVRGRPGLVRYIAQIQAVQVLHAEHFARRRHRAHAPAREHDAGVGDLERLDRVLLDHQHAHAQGV